jgi:hypothetical protein
MAQIALAALVIAPLARPQTIQWWVVVVGVMATVAFMVFGYLLDGTEVQR